MKKIILLLVILSAGFFSSCSKDDDSNDTTPTPESLFTAKVNGVQKNFIVTNVDVIEAEEGYTDVEITAQISGDPTNTFELNLTRDFGEVYFVQYLETGNYYQPVEPFTLILGENSESKIKGTFSGTLQHTANELEPITITDGSFEVYY